MSNPPEKRFMKSPNENARLFTNRCRVIIVDDHHVVRTGLRAVLSESPRLEVVGEADTAAEAVAICARVAISLAASRPARRWKPVSKNSRQKIGVARFIHFDAEEANASADAAPNLRIVLAHAASENQGAPRKPWHCPAQMDFRSLTPALSSRHSPMAGSR